MKIKAIDRICSKSVAIAPYDDRQGIALIIVLGFLTLLTIMSIGMAISMRTERLSSASHLNMVRARLLCQASLASAMLHIEEAADIAARAGAAGAANRFMPDFEQYLETTPIGRRLLENLENVVLSNRGLVLPSTGSTDMFTESLISGLGKNWVNFIPGLLWRMLYDNEASHGSDALHATANWLHTTNSVTGDIDGRFMYLVFNASGRYDINYFDEQLPPYNHDMKMNWRIMRDLQYFSNYSKEELFGGATRYETSQDIERDIGRYTTGSDWSVDGETPWMLDTFSYFPPMRRVEVDGDRIEVDLSQLPAFLSTDFSELQAARDEIVSAFQVVIDRSQWRSADEAVSAEELYSLLLDYVDDGFTPFDNNHNRASIKPVPMINEVFLAEEGVAVEVWNPFVGPSSYIDSFRVDVELEGEVIVDGEMQTTSFSLRSNHYIIDKDDYEPIVVLLPTGSGSDLEGQFDVTVQIVGTAGVLDKVQDVFRLTVGEYAQVNDPRFNHLSSQWLIDEEGTLGDINSNANFASVPDQGQYLKDGDPMMYCARSELRCTGELGYFPVAPWRTIKLYQDPREEERNMDLALDYFTMLPTDGPTFGMMNPNEKYHFHSLSNAAFEFMNSEGNWQMHLDERSTFTEFRRVPIDLVNIMNEFVNLSDLGLYLYSDDSRNRNLAPSWYNFPTDWVRSYKESYDPNRPEWYSEIRIEHMMRRASALFHLRQNIFIVCIWAQTLGPPAAGNAEDWASYPITSEAQAVAMVWRDPYPDANGDHPKFVRYMRWME